ncbi:MAG: PHP domain-containing protein [Deltaproteobacteria bacterium]|nr:PHP domain-containing protein [Deltaproteobacteria bacterium]
MLKVFNCDLHIHTCLSPCAELDMHPRALVEKALAAGLDALAICDHNSSENVPYVMKAARGKNLAIFPGMEITTSEEVHFLALFDSLSNLNTVQEFVYQHLPGKNDEDRFGVQAIVNENGEVEGLSDKLLIGATDIPLSDLLNFVHEQNGLTVASHIDRESFSVLGQLGFIDASINFDALEVTPLTGLKQAREKYRDLSNYPFITSSDAHFLKDIGKAKTKIMLDQPTLAELKMAFTMKNGRCILEQ